MASVMTSRNTASRTSSQTQLKDKAASRPIVALFLISILSSLPSHSYGTEPPTNASQRRVDDAGDQSSELFAFHTMGQGFGDVIRHHPVADVGDGSSGTGEQHEHFHAHGHGNRHHGGHASSVSGATGVRGLSPSDVSGLSDDSTSSGPPVTSARGKRRPNHFASPSPPPSYFDGRRRPTRRPPFVFPGLSSGSSEDAGTGDDASAHNGYLGGDKHPFLFSNFEQAGPATPSPTSFQSLFQQTASPISAEEEYIGPPVRNPSKPRRHRKRPHSQSEPPPLGLPSYPPASPNPHAYFPTPPSSSHEVSYPSHPFLQDPWTGTSVEVGANEHSGEDYAGEAHGYTIACTDFRGQPGRCVPAVKCTRFSQEIATAKGGKGACEYHYGAVGVCCPAEYPHDTGRAALLPTIDFRGVPGPRLSKYDVDEASYAGLAEVDQWNRIEKDLLDNDAFISPGAPAHYHHGLIRILTDHALNNSRSAVAGVGASNFLIQRFQMNPIESGFQLKAVELDESVLADSCPPPPRCSRDTQFYRTYDGSCNNLQNPTWGMARIGMQRVLPPTYEDGVYAARRLSVTGGLLPSPRLVSASIVGDLDKPHPIFTNIASDWGQFIDHDFARAGMFKLNAKNNTAIRCCQDGQQISPSPHPACMPIEIPQDDPFYSQFRQTCMEFVRSLPAFDCRLGYVDQMNQVTNFLDASTVYGSDDEVAEDQRFFSNGQMQTMTTVVDRPLLALQTVGGDGCGNLTINRRCFRAGDDRVNQNVMLVLHHTIFVREHNRIAAELQTINPRWNDELLYQEARRIVSAEVQHITYNEFLRLMIGERAMVAYRLNPQEEGFSKDYDPNVNPTITTEFATAGYRLHSMPSGVIRPIAAGEKRPSGPGLLLRDLFFDPVIAFSQTESDEFLRGTITQPVQKMDHLMSIELTQHLFEGNNPFGLDLASLNMQRGRDHGLPTYNTMREACGLPRARDFHDLADIIPAKVLKKFQQVYAHVDDIDLFVAGISERQIDHDSFVGPTFACIIADQFARLKRGDRFFYEFAGQPASFTRAQLREIKKISLARIFCDNTDIGEIQPLVFLQPSKLNHRVDCNSTAIPRMNLRLWKDTRYDDDNDVFAGATGDRRQPQLHPGF